MDRAGDPRPHSGPALGARDRIARKVRRSLRPPRTLRPTRAGWAFFALTMGVGVAALNTGNNLLYMVLALLLAFLVLSGVLSEAALRGIRVRRRLPSEAQAERDATVVLEIQNDQRRAPAFAIVVEDRGGRSVGRGPGFGRVFALRIEPGETVSRAYRFVPERRGRLGFTGFHVATRFPFGLFSKAMVLEDEAELLVFPAVDPFALRPATALAGEHGDSAGGHAGESAEVIGLREYAPGDPQRRIHWRASLQRGQLQVRERERDERSELTLKLVTDRAEDPERFEETIRATASEIVAHLDAGWRVGLRTDRVELPLAAGAPQRRRLLGFLADVEPDPEAASG